MDTILNNTIPTNYFTFSDEPELDASEKLSLWAVEGEIIRPSTSLKILKKFPSGVYKVNISREIGYYISKINISSDELYLFDDELITKTVEEINNFWDKAEEYKKNKVIHKRGVLFYGYPGCGKTSLISLLCEELIKRNGVIFTVTDTNNLTVYANFIKHSFRQIEPDTPVITIIEDLDKYTDSDELLDFLDGKYQIEHHLVLATSNNTRDIPDTYTRPSRIDLKIEISNPSTETRRKYFEKKGVSEEQLENFVTNTDGFSFADIKEIYLATVLLGYNVEDAIKKIVSKNVRKNYSSKSLSGNKIGL